jgi:hypothetical protein
MNGFLAHSPAFAALWIVAWTGSSACDSGGQHDGGNDLAVSFAGPWEGTWTPATTAASGELTLQLDQNGTSVIGTATFAAHPCLATCTVSCQVMDHEMAGWFNAGSVQMTFAGSCPESNHCSGPHHANTLTATYEIQEGPCAGESGVMHLTPVAAHEVNASEVGAVYVGEVILLDPVDGNVVRLPLFERP